MSLNDFNFIVMFVPMFTVMLVLQLLRKKVEFAGEVQLFILLAFSYAFICYSDIRFGICVAVITAISYMTGFMMQNYPDYKRKILSGGVFHVS